MFIKRETELKVFKIIVNLKNRTENRYTINLDNERKKRYILYRYSTVKITFMRQKVR